MCTRLACNTIRPYRLLGNGPQIFELKRNKHYFVSACSLHVMCIICVHKYYLACCHSLHYFQPDNGVQLYLEIVDSDGISNQDELIDRFAIDLPDASNFLSVEVYTGVFGFAEIELSFERVCAENFYGPRCEVFCVENCCEVVNVNCNNGTCIQGIGSITCVCEPGFTGTDCSTDINECEGVNCNNGTCIQGIGSITCVCEPGFTGEFCTTRVAASSQQLIAAITTPVLIFLLIVIVVVLASLYLRRRKDNSQHMHYDTDGFPLAVRPTITGNHEGSNVTTRENTSSTASILEDVSSYKPSLSLANDNVRQQ